MFKTCQNNSKPDGATETNVRHSGSRVSAFFSPFATTILDVDIWDWEASQRSSRLGHPMNGLCDVKSRNRVRRKSSLMTHGSWMPTSTFNHDQPHRDRKIVLSLLQEGSKLVWIMSIYQCRTVSDFWNILYPLVVRKKSTFTSIYKRSLSTRMEVFPCHCQKNCQRVFLSEAVSKAQLVAALFFFYYLPVGSKHDQLGTPT